MHSLQTTRKSTITPHDQHIVRACQEAATAEVNCALKSLTAGQLLIEKRHDLEITSHGGKSWHKNDHNKPDASQFGIWLESVGIPRATAYRWMDCADRVMRCHLGVSLSDEMLPFIEVEGTQLPHSHLLTLPADELPDAARELRQRLFDFMEHKSLGEAARAAFAGDAPGHRISRAGNGQSRGGTTDRDDRKAFHQFVIVKLQQIDTHLAHWKKMTPLQRTEITTALVAALSGEAFKPSFTRAPVQFKLWPEDLCAAMSEALRLRLKGTKGGGR